MNGVGYHRRFYRGIGEVVVQPRPVEGGHEEDYSDLKSQSEDLHHAEIEKVRLALDNTRAGDPYETAAMTWDQAAQIADEISHIGAIYPELDPPNTVVVLEGADYDDPTDGWGRAAIRASAYEANADLVESGVAIPFIPGSVEDIFGHEEPLPETPGGGAPGGGLPGGEPGGGVPGGGLPGGGPDDGEAEQPAEGVLGKVDLKSAAIGAVAGFIAGKLF